MVIKKNEETILSCENSDNDNCSSTDPSQENESSGKKKTPMCLVNELARHHKLQPQYKLVNETGPAHQKNFTVSLKLGDEEYNASGPSIKRAQHAAAQQALQNSKYPQPQPKPKVKNPVTVQGDMKPITPTVQLNALAMKLNLPPIYTAMAPVPTVQAGTQPFGHNHPMNGKLNGIGSVAGPPSAHCRSPAIPPRFTSNVHQRYYVNRCPPIPMTHRVSLAVGETSVVGEGATPQAARHDAARQALEELREKMREATRVEKEAKNELVPVGGADCDSELKSPVSIVHELALKLNQNVEFVVLTESGPPHMKNFVIQCKLSDWSTQGEGNCKKLAKKKAAELMLAELKKAHPNGIVSTTEQPISNSRTKTKSKPIANRKKPRNLVKESVCSSAGNRPQDPISHLVQLQQSRKEKEPIFTVISEKGIPRQPEFIVQVTVGTLVATGIGARKKEAKRAAALRALEALGVGMGSEINVDASVPVSQPTESKPPGRQIPGLIVLPRPIENTSSTNSSTANASTPHKTVSASAAEVSPSCVNQQQSKPNKSCSGVRPESRLIYLAQVLGHEVDFTDFPKGSCFISLVTMNTSPPKVSHGTGSTLEEAHDNAAENMLKLLAEGGLDALSKSDKEEDEKK